MQRRNPARTGHVPDAEVQLPADVSNETMRMVGGSKTEEKRTQRTCDDWWCVGLHESKRQSPCSPAMDRSRKSSRHHRSRRDFLLQPSPKLLRPRASTVLDFGVKPRKCRLLSAVWWTELTWDRVCVVGGSESYVFHGNVRWQHC